jgi:hypothetical protein
MQKVQEVCDFGFQSLQKDFVWKGPLIFSSKTTPAVATVSVFEETVRFQLFPSGKPRINKTWNIVPSNAQDIAPNGTKALHLILFPGQDRQALNFDTPEIKVSVLEDKLEIESKQLFLRIQLGKLRISWFIKGQDQPFAKDCVIIPLSNFLSGFTCLSLRFPREFYLALHGTVS